MKLPKAFITYSTKDGSVIKRQPVEVMFTSGEPDPRRRVVSIELPGEADGSNQSVEITVPMLERACGFKIKVLGK